MSLISDGAGDSVPDAISSSLDSDLIQRPPSPALPMDYAFDRDFSKQLSRKLELLLFSQQLRRRLYGIHVADDYPISHTPPEIKESYMKGRQVALQELEAPTPDEEDMEQEQVGAFQPLVQPPSPDTPTSTCWKKTNTIKLAPRQFIQTPDTPPSSSDDEDLEPARSVSTGSISARPGMRGKRSFAQMMDKQSEQGPCRQRRRILPTKRVSTGVP